MSKLKLGCGLLIVIALIIGIFGPKNSKKKSSESVVQTISDSATKQFIRTFYVKLTSAEKPASKAKKQFEQFIGYYQYGATDRYNVYEAAEIAQKNCSNVHSVISNIEIPEGIPQNIKDTLESVKDDLSTGYYTQSEAYEYAKTYINEGNLENISKFKEQIQTSNAFIMGSVLKLTVLMARLNILDQVKPSKKKHKE